MDCLPQNVPSPVREKQKLVYRLQKRRILPIGCRNMQNA